MFKVEEDHNSQTKIKHLSLRNITFKSEVISFENSTVAKTSLNNMIGW